LDYDAAQYQNADPLQYPFTIDLFYGGGKGGTPIETVEVTGPSEGGYTVVRNVGCKPAGDWPSGGDAAINASSGGGGE
jgi:hypothetical protein